MAIKTRHVLIKATDEKWRLLKAMAVIHGQSIAAEVGAILDAALIRSDLFKHGQSFEPVSSEIIKE